MRPRLPFGNAKATPDIVNENDPTEWLINSGFAEFILLHTLPIKYMIMFGYTYMAGMLLTALFCLRWYWISRFLIFRPNTLSLFRLQIIHQCIHVAAY